MTLVAIWSVSALLSLPGLAVSPILGKLTSIFPHASDLEIQMLTSLPSVLIIPFMLLSGKLSVKRDKVGLLRLGLALFLGCGILYFFANSMTTLIIISCILGVGAGMIIPISKGLVVDYFQGEYRVKQLGLTSAINNMTQVMATLLAGYLAGINWHYPFAVYLLPGVALLLSVFLRKEPPRTVEPSKAVPAVASKTAPAGIDKHKLVQLMALYFFITYAVLVVVYYLPFLTETHHMSSSFSGLVLSCFFLAIMFPGFFLNRIIAMWKGRIVFYSLLFAIAGLVLIAVAPHKTLLIVGSLLAGVGYGVLQPLIYDKTALIAPKKLATLALSFVMSVNYLAIMICPFIVDALRPLFHAEGNRFPFVLNAVLVTALAIYTYFKQHTFALGMSPEYYDKAKSN